MSRRAGRGSGGGGISLSAPLPCQPLGPLIQGALRACLSSGLRICGPSPSRDLSEPASGGCAWPLRRCDGRPRPPAFASRTFSIPLVAAPAICRVLDGGACPAGGTYDLHPQVDLPR